MISTEERKTISKNNKTKIEPGCRIGMLTVETDSGERKNGYIIWTCRCDCGNTIDVDMRTLRRGTVTDCGCVTKIRSCQRDVTNMRFGMLTARYCTNKKDKNGSYIWHCACDCGGEVDVALHQLQAGYRRSCGCLSHPSLKKLIGKRFGMLTVTGYAGKWDGMHRWECQCDCGNKTVVGQTLLLNGKTRSCGCIRANVYKENLKLVDGTSVAILERVHKAPISTNTSGHTGVYLNKRNNKWYAQIGFQGGTYYLGSYENFGDAVEARKKGEAMHEDFIEWYYKEYLPSQNKGSHCIKKADGKESANA